jgi:UDP-glucuronate 4-epimerase
MVIELKSGNDMVLVTGAAGFIGSHLCDELLKQQKKVIGLDNLNDYYNPDIKRRNIDHLTQNPNFEFVKCDIRDIDAVSLLFNKRDINSVAHLAAMVGVRYSIQAPNEYVDVNIGGLSNIIQCAAKKKVENFVFASSSSVYGNRTKVPFKEDDTTDFPYSPYAATKKAGEALLHAFHSLYKIPTTCLRFFTVYGPRGRPDMATFKFIDRIYKGLAIQQYGDGSSAYTFVLDIVEGIMVALDKPQEFEIYNLGGSSPIKLSDYIRNIENVVGKEAYIEKLENQAGDVTLTYADISKAKRDLNYSPSYSIEKGLEETFEWYQTITQ